MTDPKPLIIAHRGASAYLPEHSLEAKALAVGLGADYLEQDVVATRDDRLVVLHDIYLDRVTDVALRFPSRQRQDGRFYVRDFDFAELETLNVHERRNADGRTAVYPARFPTNLGRFRIATFDDEIDMIRGLEQSTGRPLGIYPEIKRPAWHREEGIDIGALLLQTLGERGFHKRSDRVYLQCFDAGELRRIRVHLDSDLRLVQLIGETTGRKTASGDDEIKTPAGLARLAETVDGIGPSLAQLYARAQIDGQPVSTGMVSAAHAAGLTVHPYTFRADALMPGFASFDDMVLWFAGTLKIDGLFTDFPDRARTALDRLQVRETKISV